MPKKIERQLKARAKKLGLSAERASAYVYGTLRTIPKKAKYTRP